MSLLKKPRIIYNDDSDTLTISIPQPHTIEKISLAVDYLKGTQVDCLCWCVADQLPYSYPSKTEESTLEKMKAAMKGLGKDEWLPEFFNFNKSENLMLSLYLQGIDYLPILIGLCRKQGLQFFASFRMNDTHLKSNPEGVFAPEFWRKHQEYRLWEVTDGKTYLNAALDYSYPEVRKRYLVMIDEVARKYDVDGIELDFCRTPYIFQPSEAWTKRDILTSFVKEIKENLADIGKVKKKDMVLVIRVPFGEERLAKAGIDLKDWSEKRYPEILVMSNLTNDYNLNVEPWLSLCRKDAILFFPSVEADPAIYRRYFYETISNPIAPAHNYNAPKDVEVTIRRIRGAAQNFLSQGVDGIYLFNYPCILNERKNNRYKNAVTFKKLTLVLNEIGDSKTLKGTAKQYTFWPELPISVESGRPPQFHQTIRFNILDPDTEKSYSRVVLRFRQVAERNPHAPTKYWQSPFVKPGMIEYYLNEKKIAEEYIKRKKQPKGRIPSGFWLRNHESMEIRLPANKLKVGENSLSFFIRGLPKEKDPYVYIYELEVEVFTGNS